MPFSTALISLVVQLIMPPDPVVYGYSVQGRPIQVTSLGTGPVSVLVVGGVHGDETPAAPLVEDLFADVRVNLAKIDGLTVHFLLQANPDGVAAKTRQNANKVDINRNMADEWQPESEGDRTYPGPAPYSEPETVALRSVVETLAPKRILSVHAFANILDFDTPGGKALAEKMALHNQMRVQTIGYPTPGSFGRFCTARNIPLVTLELKRNMARQQVWDWQKNAVWAFLNG